MNAFFDTDMRRMRLAVEAQAWLGTPFSAHSRLMHAGVDCVHLCAEIYRECGLFEHYEFPRYALDSGAHLESSLVLAWVRDSKCFEAVMENGKWKMEKEDGAARPSLPICPGDLLCFKTKKVEHHVGVAIIAERFIHCVEKHGVMISEAADPIYKRALTHVFRPISGAHGVTRPTEGSES